jgi:hypothetical protein
MSRKPQMSPAQLEYAADAIRRGTRTRAELAAEFGVSPPAVTAALKRREAKLSAEGGNEKRAGAVLKDRSAPRAAAPTENDEADNLPPDLVPPPTMTLDDQRAWFADTITTYSRIAAELMAAGETVEARKSSEIAVKAQMALLRINKVEDADVLHISRDDLKERRERVLATAKKVMSERGLLCSSCNRALSVRWGSEQ